MLYVSNVIFFKNSASLNLLLSLQNVMNALVDAKYEYPTDCRPKASCWLFNLDFFPDWRFHRTGGK